MLSICLCAQLACIWEATARKPGNVHRFQDFTDTHYLDFLLSAAAIAPVMESAPARRVGLTILEAIRATRRVVAGNTNLGIVLLLAPLATVPRAEVLSAGVARILDGLDVADARDAYEAIRLASPGGLGESPAQDVNDTPTVTLCLAMAWAADRDLVARQYASRFREVFEVGVPVLLEGVRTAGSLEAAIVRCHLHLMAEFPDSLIQRKRGRAIAEEAAQRARRVLENKATAMELDIWLRADGNARNPGTTADLVTACLFASLRTGELAPPFPAWS